MEGVREEEGVVMNRDRRKKGGGESCGRRWVTRGKREREKEIGKRCKNQGCKSPHTGHINSRVKISTPLGCPRVAVFSNARK